MRLNGAGMTVKAVLDRLPRHFRNIELDAFIVMPNHVHGIIVIKDREINQDIGRVPARGAPSNSSLPHGTQPGSLGAIVQNFKSVSTRRVNRLMRNAGTIWQRDYYEEIVRDEGAYYNIRRYIMENPLRWEEDEENPINHKNCR
jgi:REP element-mobilizing transposase RayT